MKAKTLEERIVWRDVRALLQSRGVYDDTEVDRVARDVMASIERQRSTPARPTDEKPGT